MGEARSSSRYDELLAREKTWGVLCEVRNVLQENLVEHS